MGNSTNIYIIGALIGLIVLGAVTLWYGPNIEQYKESVGPTMTRAEFIERMDYLARNGGEWTAANPDYVEGEGSPVSFGYRFRWGPNQGYAVVEIFGSLEDGTEQLYWEIMSAWHPETQQAAHFQAGVGGTVGKGVAFYPDEITEEILIEFTNPDGSKFYLRDVSEIIDEDQFVSRSYIRFSLDEEWQASQVLHWERVGA